METKISGRNMDLTDANVAYGEKKLAKLPKYFDRVQQLEMLVEKRKDDYHVEILADVEHHKGPFVANAADIDLYAAMDGVTDKAIRQLKEHKDRLRDHKHQTGTGASSVDATT